MVGVVAFRDLVFTEANSLIADIMKPDVAVLRVNDDQEQIAREIQRHSFLGLPVVDESGRLVGVVRAHDALRVAEAPWQQAIRKRFPWLAINLCTALGGVFVVSLFESTISRWTAFE